MEPTTFPRTVDEIFEDYSYRRFGLQRALTDDAELLWEKCDPERENLCLYGDRAGGWAVEPPAEEIPAELPEPCIGINFARDGLSRAEWLALAAAHSDAWLCAVAFFYGVKLDGAGRARLHKQINSLPTLFEVVTGAARPSAPPLPFPAGSVPASANGGSRTPDPNGRVLGYDDITPRLQGKYTELYWPDDEMWYLVYVDRIDVRAKSATIIYYPSEELEELDMDEIARDGHMVLLPQAGLL